MYSQSGDPWELGTRWYEQRKYAITLAMLPNERYAHAFEPGCSVGEMGLLEKRPRSAEVVADEDVEAYLLTEEGFEIILHEHPRIARALLASIARQLAHRLRDTSDELRSLAH